MPFYLHDDKQTDDVPNSEQDIGTQLTLQRRTRHWCGAHGLCGRRPRWCAVPRGPVEERRARSNPLHLRSNATTPDKPCRAACGLANAPRRRGITAQNCTALVRPRCAAARLLHVCCTRQHVLPPPPPPPPRYLSSTALTFVDCCTAPGPGCAHTRVHAAAGFSRTNAYYIGNDALSKLDLTEAQLCVEDPARERAAKRKTSVCGWCDSVNSSTRTEGPHGGVSHRTRRQRTGIEPESNRSPLTIHHCMNAWVGGPG